MLRADVRPTVLAGASSLVQTARMTRHRPHIFPLATLLAVVLMLAGCGFHLRDALLLPPDLGPLQVTGTDRDGPLVNLLESALARAGATVVGADGDAAIAAADAQPVARLRILSERLGDTPISVDRSGRSQEFNLRYAVIFDLHRADGSNMVPQQAIELSRDYLSAPTSSAGTEGEREILIRELRRDMVSSILHRIDAVSRMVPATTPAAAVVPASTP